MKIITSTQEFMRLAYICGQAEMKAKRSNRKEDHEAFVAAEKEFQAYRTLCLESDEMATGFTVGQLYYGK